MWAGRNWLLVTSAGLLVATQAEEVTLHRCEATPCGSEKWGNRLQTFFTGDTVVQFDPEDTEVAPEFGEFVGLRQVDGGAEVEVLVSWPNCNETAANSSSCGANLEGLTCGEITGFPEESLRWTSCATLFKLDEYMLGCTSDLLAEASNGSNVTVPGYNLYSPLSFNDLVSPRFQRVFNDATRCFDAGCAGLGTLFTYYCEGESCSVAVAPSHTATATANVRNSAYPRQRLETEATEPFDGARNTVGGDARDSRVFAHGATADRMSLAAVTTMLARPRKTELLSPYDPITRQRVCDASGIQPLWLGASINPEELMPPLHTAEADFGVDQIGDSMWVLLARKEVEGGFVCDEETTQCVRAGTTNGTEHKTHGTSLYGCHQDCAQYSCDRDAMQCVPQLPYGTLGEYRTRKDCLEGCVQYECNTTTLQCAALARGDRGEFPTLGACEEGCVNYRCNTETLECERLPWPEPGQPRAECEEQCVAYTCDAAEGKCLAQPYGHPGQYKNEAECVPECFSYTCSDEFRCEKQEHGLPGFPTQRTCEDECILYRCDFLQCKPLRYSDPVGEPQELCESTCVQYDCNRTSSQCVPLPYLEPGEFGSKKDCEAVCLSYTCDEETATCRLQPYGEPDGFPDARSCQAECHRYNCNPVDLTCEEQPYAAPGDYGNQSLCEEGCVAYNCNETTKQCYPLPYGEEGEFQSIWGCEADCVKYDCDGDLECVRMPYDAPGGFITEDECRTVCVGYNCSESMQCLVQPYGEPVAFKRSSDCAVECVQYDCNEAEGECEALPYGKRGEFPTKPECEAACHKVDAVADI